MALLMFSGLTVLYFNSFSLTLLCYFITELAWWSVLVPFEVLTYMIVYGVLAIAGRISERNAVLLRNVRSLVWRQYVILYMLRLIVLLVFGTLKFNDFDAVATFTSTLFVTGSLLGLAIQKLHDRIHKALFEDLFLTVGFKMLLYGIQCYLVIIVSGIQLNDQPPLLIGVWSILSVLVSKGDSVTDTSARNEMLR
jgi:hypothetical protein